MNKDIHEKTKLLALLALFTAIVVVLQLIGSSIKLGIFSISLVLAPIVVGAALCGPVAGAYLGGVFGVVVLLSGDAAPFMAINIPGTILTVMAKGILSGFVSGVVYKLLEKKNQLLAVFTSAVVCPIVNTGVFLIGCLLFFMGMIRGLAQNFGFGENVVRYMFLGLVGGNFLIELLVNTVLSSVISMIIKIGRKILR